MLLKIEDDQTPPLPVIFGLSGEKLSKDEKALFTSAKPLGFILFARNCKNPKQLKKLIDDLKSAMGCDVPILIDQEGGRVQRLRAPEWTDYPPARQFGEAFLRDFAKGRQDLKQNTNMITRELFDVGVNVNCAPVMDVLYPVTHDAIGDRAFSKDPEMVAALGGVVCEEHLKAGIIPVVKHMPGQGRAASDSHHDLPVIRESYKELKNSDLLPFKELLRKAYSEAVWGMVSHIVYFDIDSRAPASCSRKVIQETIRQEIGFNGLLLSDDLCMGALERMGDAASRADKALKAGCDVILHCNGNLSEMENVASRVEKMTSKAVMRYNRSVAWVKRNFKHA